LVAQSIDRLARGLASGGFVKSAEFKACESRGTKPNADIGLFTEPSTMIVKTAEFITSAVKPDQYPEAHPPEVAFAGRSNVGKSSLINTLVNRKRLVKTSSTPGRTQLINFFSVNDSLYLVDLPGYGYAKVPAAVRRKWGPMIETYLKGRQTLAAVVLILDIRRVPGEEELNFIDWLKHYHRKAILVLTKADKLSKTKQTKKMQAIATALGIQESALITFSAKTRLGKADVWSAIETAALKDNHEQD
jgi:GTP-binding protein